MARRPASKPVRSTANSSVSPALAAAVKRINGERSPAERLTTMSSKLDEIRRRIAYGHELWTAMTGEPMPLTLEGIRIAAIRFGLPSDTVHKGDFTLAEVTDFMVGKRLAADDDAVDRARAAVLAEMAVRRAAATVMPGTSTPDDTQAEAVDDEYAGIARRLSDNARSMLRYLLVVTAFDRASCFDLNGIASDLELSGDAVRSARREVGSIKPPLLESARGRGNGVWLSPTGRLVAERIPPSTCRQACLAEISTNKHKTGAA